MGKFDGILLCTDLDGTLLDDNHHVSKENSDAIEYFKSEGGKFTFVTGRVPAGAKLLLEFVHPNTPVVTFNGAGIYDFEKDELVWGIYLDEKAVSVIEYVEERFPGIGLVVCTDKRVCFCQMNRWVQDYFETEKLPLDTPAYKDIKEPWKKSLFITDEKDISKVKKIIAESKYASLYEFVQSGSHYYELLPIGATKGNGLKRLTELLGVDKNKTIAIGDNENDISMLKTAKVGIAVQNAGTKVKQAADIVTVSNNEHALAKVIELLKNGEIQI